MKFYNTIPEEQETIINIDYFERTLGKCETYGYVKYSNNKK